jgi:hypothetical protein
VIVRLITLQSLSESIFKKRREMIDLGMTCGLSDPRTVLCSQELDQKKKKIGIPSESKITRDSYFNLVFNTNLSYIRLAPMYCGFQYILLVYE